MRKVFICLILSAFALNFATSCSSITKLFPSQPRHFQPRAFNSEEWKSGDYQIRGEMLDNKFFEQIYKINSNSRGKILELLGEPDEKTKAVCCYSGRGGTSSEKVDLWLYYVETKVQANVANTTNKPPTELKKQALKIYFDGEQINPNVGNRDGDHSYFPIIGQLKF